MQLCNLNAPLNAMHETARMSVLYSSLIDLSNNSASINSFKILIVTGCRFCLLLCSSSSKFAFPRMTAETKSLRRQGDGCPSTRCKVRRADRVLLTVFPINPRLNKYPIRVMTMHSVIGYDILTPVFSWQAMRCFLVEL